MATVVKHLLTFRDNSGTGFTEVHYRLNAGTNPALNGELDTLVGTIAPLRAQLLSMDCVCIGARVSYPRLDAIASLNKKFFLQGNPVEKGVSQAISLAVGWTDVAFTKTKITHIRGFWDSVEYNGEYHPDGDETGTWEPKVNAWKEALRTAGYGWLSKDPAKSARGTVTTYVAGVDGRVTFTLGTNIAAVAPVGSVISIRFSGLNRRSSTLNKSLIVEVLTGTSVRTVNQVATGPFLSQGRFNFRGTTFTQYAGVTNISAGRRAQGRPFDQLPGRSSARPLY